MALSANPLSCILAKSKSAASSLLPSSNPSQTPINIAVTSQPSSPPPPCSSSSSPSPVMLAKTKRRGWMLLWTTALLSPIISSNISRAQELAADTEKDEDEQRLIRLFQDTTASVVCIRDLQLVGDGKGNNVDLIDDNDEGKVKVDGIGSGFIWDKMGHIVTNYHVISKFATDRIGRQRCKVYLLDSSGNTFSKEGNLIGTDPTNDLAVLKVDVEGDQLRPAIIGTSRDLRVGQSCFAIGNPYGYEHTLTTGGTQVDL